MASFDINISDDFLKQLRALGNTDDICERMLSEAIPILSKSLQNKIKMNHVYTGDLWKSVKPGKPYHSKYGYWVVSASPNGRAKGKMKSGKVYKRSKSGAMSSGKSFYNSDKLWFLEVGTSKQAPSPVIDKAVADVEAEVLDIMQQIFNEEVTK